MVKVMEPRVEVAPFFADQRAWRAAASHLRRMVASALPLAVASVTRPSASITTLTVTIVLWRRATSGLGQLMKLRPWALPLTPTPVPPAPVAPSGVPSVDPFLGENLFATVLVAFLRSFSVLSGSSALTALSFFCVLSFGLGGVGLGFGSAFGAGSIISALSSGPGSGSPLTAGAGLLFFTAFSRQALSVPAR